MDWRTSITSSLRPVADEGRADLHRVARLDADLGDAALPGRVDVGVHLHGVEQDDGRLLLHVVARIDGAVELGAYVEAFYTTIVFKAERLILKWLVSRPSTDREARQIARAEAETFAAWELLDRTDNQLLMRDFRGQTCSWFMVEHEAMFNRMCLDFLQNG